MQFTLAVLAVAYMAVAHAQSVETSMATSTAPVTATQSQVMPASATAGFNPALVNSSITSTWCDAQRNSCPEICDGSAAVNTCNENTLTYQCTCANGTVPDCTAYKQTLPFYICQQTYIQCIASHPMDQIGQMNCKSAEQCGTLNATAQLAAAQSSSSAPAASTTGTPSSSGSGSGSESATGSGTSSTASHNAASAYNYEITTGAFATLLMAGFCLVL